MTSELMERLTAADPAEGLTGAPPVARVHTLRRRRRSRRAAIAAALGVAAAGAVAFPLPHGTDVIAQAAAALNRPGVLHLVTVTQGGGGRAETWRAPDGDERVVLYDADGALTGELALHGGESLSWNAADDTLYRTRSTALGDDPLTLLSRAKAGAPGVTQRPDATVRGIPVHVIALAATTAGGDAAPERVYYVDRRTSLPVRIRFGAIVTDVLHADRVGTADLAMSPHPGATVHDYR
jgi:hypothetical protein